MYGAAAHLDPLSFQVCGYGFAAPAFSSSDLDDFLDGLFWEPVDSVGSLGCVCQSHPSVPLEPIPPCVDCSLWCLSVVCDVADGPAIDDSSDAPSAKFQPVPSLLQVFLSL